MDQILNIISAAHHEFWTSNSSSDHLCLGWATMRPPASASRLLARPCCPSAHTPSEFQLTCSLRAARLTCLQLVISHPHPALGIPKQRALKLPRQEQRQRQRQWDGQPGKRHSNSVYGRFKPFDGGAKPPVSPDGGLWLSCRHQSPLCPPVRGRATDKYRSLTSTCCPFYPSRLWGSAWRVSEKHEQKLQDLYLWLSIWSGDYRLGKDVAIIKTCLGSGTGCSERRWHCPVHRFGTEDGKVYGQGEEEVGR